MFTLGKPTMPETCSRRKDASAVFWGLGVVLICSVIFAYQQCASFSAHSRPVVLFSTTLVHAAAPQTQSSRTCSRFKLPIKYINESQGPYNPAAVRLPDTGEWFAVFTMDEVSD